MTEGHFVASYCAASSRASLASWSLFIFHWYLTLNFIFLTLICRCHILRLRMYSTQSHTLIPHSESPTVAAPLTHLATILEPSAPTESLIISSLFTMLGTYQWLKASWVARRSHRRCSVGHLTVTQYECLVGWAPSPLTCLHMLINFCRHTLCATLCPTSSFNVLTSSGHLLPNQSYLIDHIHPIDQLQPCLPTRSFHHLPTLQLIISSLSLRLLPDRLHQLWPTSCATP